MACAPYPYLKINIDGSALSNSGIVGAEGVLRDHSGRWILGFSLHVGLTTNDMAKLAVVRQGLAMAWNMGFKFLQLELDSNVVLTWLTNNNMSYPTNMMPLICDCRNLLDHEWEGHVQYVYHEANGCADALAKQGTRQRDLVSVDSECPSVVYVSYVRDLASLGETRLCAPSTAVGDV